MDLGDELEDAGAVVVRSAAKIVIIGATIFAGIGLAGYYSAKKFKAHQERKKLVQANLPGKRNDSFDDDTLELGA